MIDPALIVVAGQGNALGYHVQVSEFPAAMVAVNAHVHIWDNATRTWQIYRAGVNSGQTIANPGACGPEVAFAYNFEQTHPGRDLYIIKEVKGSTGIAADATELDWSPHSTGELYNSATVQISAAKAALGYAHVSDILWMQGEQDAADATKSAAYGRNFSELAGDMRRDWGSVDTTLIYGRIDVNDQLAYQNGVRSAQDAYVRTDGNAFEIDTDAYPQQADHLHFNGAGQISLGTDMFTASNHRGRQ